MDTTNIFVFIMGAFSVLTNGVLLIILYLDPLKKFRTTTNCLIISLTIADFITGLNACLLSFNWEHVAYHAIFAFHWAATLNSFFTIFFLSCERLVIVTYPLKAKSLFTKRRVFSFIAANWLLSGSLSGLVVGLLPPVSHYFLFVLFFLKLLMIFVLVAIYVAIILKMRLKPKLIRESMSRRDNLQHEERRLTSILLLLVAILLVTVVPFLFASLVWQGYDIYSKPLPNALRLFIEYYYPVELLNFVVNPIIYAWRLPSFRRSLLYYLKKLSFVDGTSGMGFQEETSECPLSRYRCSQRSENTILNI